MPLRVCFGIALLTLATTRVAYGQSPIAPKGASAQCGVTSPNGRGPEGTYPDLYGNPYGTLSVYIEPRGAVVFKPGGPGFVMHDGSLGMKWGWWRGVRGQLRITGRRLDASAPPLRAVISDGYGDEGPQPTYLIFPQPGCWEVTGAVRTASITFVTRVVKIGDGPAWHYDPPNSEISSAQR
jgi:hypothetical protein